MRNNGVSYPKKNTWGKKLKELIKKEKNNRGEEWRERGGIEGEGIEGEGDRGRGDRGTIERERGGMDGEGRDGWRERGEGWSLNHEGRGE